MEIFLDSELSNKQVDKAMSYTSFSFHHFGNPKPTKLITENALRIIIFFLMMEVLHYLS